MATSISPTEVGLVHEIPPRALKIAQAARYGGVSKSYLRKKRLRGPDDPGDPGPEYIRISKNLIVYEIEALNRWLDARKAGVAA